MTDEEEYNSTENLRRKQKSEIRGIGFTKNSYIYSLQTTMF